MEARTVADDREADRAIGGGAAGQGLGGLRGDTHGAGLASAGGMAPDANPGPSGAGAGLSPSDLGGGGLGHGQPGSGATARQGQSFGQGGGAGADAGGGLNEQQDALRAQAEAQGRTDATDAQDLLDKTRASQDAGSISDNNSL
jgi:hypothetical protein